jgi:hypothetical protein
MYELLVQVHSSLHQMPTRFQIRIQRKIAGPHGIDTCFLGANSIGTFLPRNSDSIVTV